MLAYLKLANNMDFTLYPDVLIIFCGSRTHDRVHCRANWSGWRSPSLQAPLKDASRLRLIHCSTDRLVWNTENWHSYTQFKFWRLHCFSVCNSIPKNFNATKFIMESWVVLSPKAVGRFWTLKRLGQHQPWRRWARVAWGWSPKVV